jgi:hypothetical protein
MEFHSSITLSQNLTRFNPTQNINLTKNVDRYFPINWPAILQGLMPYIGHHDMLKLLMVSKTIRISILQCNILQNHDHNNSVINIIEHDCYKCMERCFLLQKNYEITRLVPKLVLAAVQYGSVKCLPILAKYLYYNVNHIHPYLPHIDRYNDNWWRLIHHCVLNAIKHKDNVKMKLLEWISRYFAIKYAETFKEIMKFHNKTIVSNVLSRYSYWQQKTDVTTHAGEELLYILCRYDRPELLFVNIENINYDSFMKLINGNFNEMTTQVLLKRFTETHEIKPEHMEIVNSLIKF